MEENNDVGTPFGMVDQDDRPTRSGRTKGVEGGWDQKSVEAWLGSDLRNEPVTLLDKFPLLHYQTSERVHCLAITDLAIFYSDDWSA